VPKRTTKPLRDNDVVSLLTEEADWKTPPKLKRAQDLNKQIPRFVPPQESLVPIGNGFYATPSSPARLGDCDRWKGFPGCGGKTLVKGAYSLGFDIVKSENLVGIQLSPGAFGLALPEFQITYGHRFTLPNHIEVPKGRDRLPVLTTGAIDGLGRGIDPNQLVYCAVNRWRRWKNINTRCTNESAKYGHTRTDTYTWKQPTKRFSGGVTVTGVEAERTYEFTPNGNWSSTDSATGCFINVVEPTNTVQTSVINQSSTLSGQIVYNANGAVQRFRNGTIGSFTIVTSTIIEPQYTLYGTELEFGEGFFGSGIFNGIIFGTWGGICKTYGVKPQVNNGVLSLEVRGEVAWVVDVNGDPIGKANPPSLPPKGCCPMSCCCNGNDNNEYLLRQILEEAKKANKAIGSDDLGFSVPNDITDKTAGTRKITSLAVAHHQDTLIKDQLAGEYPVEIEVKDTNLLAEGNQSIKLKFENQAELITEVMALAYQAKVTSEAALNLTARNLSESGANKNQTYQVWNLLLAMAEYIGFQLDQEKKKVPFAYDPKANSLDGLLKETQQEQVVFKWKGGKDLQSWLADLGYAATLVKASVFRPTGSLEETKELLKESLKEPGQETDPDAVEFDDYLRQVENGFGTIPGIDSQLLNKPYGRDFIRRPNIKELGVDADAEPETT
jgi:hypothetical protein